MGNSTRMAPLIKKMHVLCAVCALISKELDTAVLLSSRPALVPKMGKSGCLGFHFNF